MKVRKGFWKTREIEIWPGQEEKLNVDSLDQHNAKPKALTNIFGELYGFYCCWSQDQACVY